MANEISAKTPNLCHLAPAGDTYIEDLDRAGGVYAVMAELTKAGSAGHLRAAPCTGKTVAENLEGVVNRDTETSSGPWTTPTPRPAASPCCRAIWPPTAAW